MYLVIRFGLWNNYTYIMIIQSNIFSRLHELPMKLFKVKLWKRNLPDVVEMIERITRNSISHSIIYNNTTSTISDSNPSI